MSQASTEWTGGEAELADAALRGDPAAHDRLYAALAGRVTVYLLRCGFDSADVEDLRQEVFLRVFSSLGSFDPARGSLRAWTGAIARNVAKRHWSRRPKWDMFEPELAEAVFADPPTPAEAPEAREEFHAVRGCVAALPAELAELVILRYRDGRTLRNIAAAMGMAESTVRLRLGEAREQIAACLRRKGIFA